MNFLEVYVIIMTCKPKHAGMVPKKNKKGGGGGGVGGRGVNELSSFLFLGKN